MYRLAAQERARLAWSCRRGMLELDLILHRFLERGLEVLTKEQLSQFNALLGCTDPQLFAWLIRDEESYDKELAPIVALVRACSSSL